MQNFKMCVCFKKNINNYIILFIKININVFILPLVHIFCILSLFMYILLNFAPILLNSSNNS